MGKLESQFDVGIVIFQYSVLTHSSFEKFML
jgi:hypothetical protein